MNIEKMLQIAATNYVNFVLFCGVILLFNLITGCAVNNFGIVNVKHFENKTVHMVNLKSYGCFLSTHEADAGLTFGFTERWYFYPKDKQIEEVSLSSMLILAKEDHLIEQGKDQTVLIIQIKLLHGLVIQKG
ncbi:hypothetical protein BMR04_09030 [Methylococcaceae bacterium HT3]|nr:hypothetical protein BMR04_09030 [Methylococcaceae bacterium HT3]